MRKEEVDLAEAVANMLRDSTLGIAGDGEHAKETENTAQARFETIYEEFALKFVDSPFYNSITRAFAKIHSYKYVNHPTFKISLESELKATAVPIAEIKKALDTIDEIVASKKPNEFESGWHEDLKEIVEKTRMDESVEVDDIVESVKTKKGNRSVQEGILSAIGVGAAAGLAYGGAKGLINKWRRRRPKCDKCGKRKTQRSENGLAWECPICNGRRAPVEEAWKVSSSAKNPIVEDTLSPGETYSFDVGSYVVNIKAMEDGGASWEIVKGSETIAHGFEHSEAEAKTEAAKLARQKMNEEISGGQPTP